MSVFQSIKGTFAAGLKSITSKDYSHDGGSAQLSKFSVNLDAGAELLHRYQQTWQEQRENADVIAAKAQDVDCLVTELYVKYDRQTEMMAKLHEELANLPVILSQLQELTDVLASLEEEVDNVESALVRLDSVCEDQDLLKAKIMDAHKLATYKERKLDELEKLKVQFAKDHAMKMQNYEKQRQSRLKERREAFEDAFNDDLDYYKSHGRVETLSTSSSTESGKRVNLEEISFDDEDEQLDEFLGTDTPLVEDKEVFEQETVDDKLEDEDIDEDTEDEDEEPRVDVTLQSEYSRKNEEGGKEDSKGEAGREDTYDIVEDNSNISVSIDAGNVDLHKQEVPEDDGKICESDEQKQKNSVGD